MKLLPFFARPGEVEYIIVSVLQSVQREVKVKKLNSDRSNGANTPGMADSKIAKKAKSTLLHKIKKDPTVGHLYPSNEKFITQRVEEFVATDPASAMTSKDQLKQSLRHELHITASQTKNHKKSSYIIQPGEVPADAPAYVPKQPKQRSQDIVDFMYQKQVENREHYHQERTGILEKSTKRSLTEYVPPVSLYAPPVQKYDKNRPYFQEYIRYRNELKPVVMPVFSLAKGSIREKAKSAFMPLPDPNFVSKRDKYAAERLEKVRAEEKEAEEIKKIQRAKKLKETQRLRELRQTNALASPIKSSRPSTSFNSNRTPLPSARPGTCNSFSPAALTNAYDRPNYPTAGTIWITDV